ncbi:phospholipid scramblase 3-like [Mercenaria mercenaria]|uniref:phospholipid scramblase 3-like n=1 Tax=Mercenaria mercenaria TaxID=6596 RepID=UPI00234FA24D|nr:phospholipid scramblase 3-like [Mercenaria mercenaria]
MVNLTINFFNSSLKCDFNRSRFLRAIKTALHGGLRGVSIWSLLGKIMMVNSKWATHIKILDETDKHVFTIWIPCCVCQDVCCPDDIVIPITDPTLTQQIGKISKVWRGCCVEAIVDADTFRLEFPLDMALNTKILLMGALFMVDYLRFEAN